MLSLSKPMKQGLRNEGVVNEDRISQLPEALLLHILSSLPTKDVVATSVLSKQWKSLWKIVSKLKFDDDDIQSKHESFAEIVCKVLLSHKAPVLERLHLSFNGEDCDAMAIGMWIGIAFSRRHLRKLVIYVDSDEGRNFVFHRSLYNCETLETLILRNWILIDVPSPVSLKSLRTLHLDGVDCKDDASVLNLLAGCPNLENLLVHPGNLLDVKIFTIAVPSLQRLTIYDDSHGHEFEGYVINAPALKFLKIQQGLKALQIYLVETLLELVEANIIDVDTTSIEKLLRSLTSVKRLSLASSAPEITFPTGTIFYRLVYLELSTLEAECWNLLLLMLKSSPKLQVLKLNSTTYYGKQYVSCEKWNQPMNASECLTRHLETFMWNGYKEQLEVAKYILRNANHLKRANFSIEGLNSDERPELLEELESAVRASNSTCKLLLS